MGRLYIDVTNSMKVGFTTGIQRTVVKFGEGLGSLTETVFIRKIIGTYEYEIISPNELLDDERKDDIKTTGIHISLEELEPEDVFFDVDAVWNNYEGRRQSVYKCLKKQGVFLVAFVHDVLPLSLPLFFREDTLCRYIAYLASVICYADLIVVSTEATKQRILRILQELEMPSKAVSVVPLGGDIFRKENNTVDHASTISLAVKEASEQPFLMTLGTIEPRKNHQLILNAYNQGLKDLPTNIVIAGRIGWNVENVVDKLQQHPDLGKKFFFLEEPTDEEVDYLYKKCWGIIFPSFGEGYGLPLIEALHYGKIVFASDIDVFHEIGGDACIYFDPYNSRELVECIANIIASPEKEMIIKQKILEFQTPSWSEASEKLYKEIQISKQKQKEDSSHKRSVVSTFPKQLFMISARVDDIVETLPYYEHFMSFLTEVVIGCPEKIKKALQDSYHGNLKMRIITDEELLNGATLPQDHQERNLLLRALAIKHDSLDDAFIMADDDNRPLREINENYYIKEGKYTLYYCNADMSQWHGAIGRPTSYDLGIANTAKVLTRLNLPLKQYSSHAPQIICKQIYQEILEKYPDVWHQAVDEWSLYGNYATATYPYLFRSEPYATMNWPAIPNHWKVTLPPKEYIFENFYRELYDEGQIFGEFSTRWTEKTIMENVRKVQIRMQIQDQYAAGERAADLCDDLFRKLYHHPPVWQIDLDHSVITVPEVLLGPKGHWRKVPVMIINKHHKSSLSIEGWFEESGSGKYYGFNNEHIDVSNMHGEQVITVCYPDWSSDGYLHLTFTVDEMEIAKTQIPVIAY